MLNGAMPSDRPPPTPLSYRGPGAATRRDPRLPHPTPVVLLCLPGLVCWLLFFRAISRALVPRTFSLGPIDRFGITSTLWLWLLAVLTATFSVIRYAFRKPKPWYLWLNLVINVAGLLFTLGVLFLILISRSA